MFGSGEVMARLAWVMVMGLVEIGVGHGDGFGGDRPLSHLSSWIGELGLDWWARIG